MTVTAPAGDFIRYSGDAFMIRRATLRNADYRPVRGEAVGIPVSLKSSEARASRKECWCAEDRAAGFWT